MRTKVFVASLAVVFLVSLIAFGQAPKPNLDMKKVADKIVKTLSSGDPAAVANLYAPDAVMIQPDTSEPVRGRDALLKYYAAMYKAMPDQKVDFSLVTFLGDTVICEGVSYGTFTGTYSTSAGDIPPTGKKITIKMAFFGKINAEGLIAEDRSYFDNYEFMKQLGLIK
jgi:steroid delta-isomerase-like uncharacterized protein